IGNIALRLDLTGPGGVQIARDFTVGVRPAQAYQLRRFVGRLEPGQSVTLDDGAAGEFLPGTAEALLSVSPRPDWDVPGLLRAHAGELGALRYFTDTKLSELPTQLAKAQLGAALAQYGDTQRASAAYAVAMGPPPKRPAGLRYVDYGSDLRDSAAALAFVASNPGAPPRLTATMDRIAELFARANRTSTQEQ